MRAIKDCKALGPGNTDAEFPKLFGKDKVRWLNSIFNHVYETRNIHLQWLRTEFITLTKQPKAKTYGNQNNKPDEPQQNL